jgi:hypothetical protein
VNVDANDFDIYLTERYYPQIDWYDKKSISNQRVYKAIQWIVIILAAVTPILVVIGGTWERWCAVTVSVLVAIGTSVMKVFKYQENWINYRTTCETLRKEIYFYKAGIYDYEKCDDPMALFVQRVETLISRENTMWLSVQKKDKDSSKIERGQK